MRAKEYPILCRCLEDGIEAGVRRARKHVESPSDDEICGAIYEAILGELFEYFELEDVAAVEDDDGPA